jgi:hypothetical protein
VTTTINVGITEERVELLAQHVQFLRNYLARGEPTQLAKEHAETELRLIGDLVETARAMADGVRSKSRARFTLKSGAIKTAMVSMPAESPKAIDVIDLSHGKIQMKPLPGPSTVHHAQYVDTSSIGKKRMRANGHASNLPARRPISR